MLASVQLNHYFQFRFVCVLVALCCCCMMLWRAYLCFCTFQLLKCKFSDDYRLFNVFFWLHISGRFSSSGWFLTARLVTLIIISKQKRTKHSARGFSVLANFMANGPNERVCCLVEMLSASCKYSAKDCLLGKNIHCVTSTLQPQVSLWFQQISLGLGHTSSDRVTAVSGVRIHQLNFHSHEQVKLINVVFINCLTPVTLGHGS